MADNQITPFQLTDQFTMDNFNQRINETNIALQNNDPKKWGLGTIAKRFSTGDDLNNYTVCGFFGHHNSDVINSLLNKPPYDFNGGEVELLVIANQSGYLTQILHNSHNGVTAQRDIKGSTVCEWGYVNPLMNLGIEYRTTERHNGKAVYTQARSVPSGPALNSITIVTFSGSEGATEFVDYGGSLTDGSFICAIPGVDGAGNALLNAGPICSASSSALQIYMKNVGSFALTSFSGTCWVKYTKD